MTRLSVALAVGLLAMAGAFPATLGARPAARGLPSQERSSPGQPAPAQSPASPVAPTGTGRLTPLKVQLVVTRTFGGKQVSSLPYLLWITANDRQPTSLKMGVEVPISTGTSSYNYRPVGTNIDCMATTFENSYHLNITLSDSSIHFVPKDASNATPLRPGDAQPAFRSFTSRFSILLKDGQTAQYTSATDPVNGETLKVDVTLNVLK